MEERQEDNQTYTWLDRVAYWLFRLVIAAIQSQSLERCQRMSRLLAHLFVHWIPIRRELVQTNLQRVFPDYTHEQVVAVQEEMWEHLFLMLCEVAHAPLKIHRENWHEHFYFPSRREMLQVVLDTRPKVLVSGHFGNFELAGFVTGLFGVGTTTIARPLDNGFVHDYVNRFRSMGGQYMVPKNGSSSQIEELLQQGGALSLLADQYGGPKGCWVEFLGQLASCHKALALFTLSSGAPMMVCTNLRKGRPLQFELRVVGIADPSRENCPDSVQDLTCWYNRCLEKEIRKCPSQYWWVHHRWKGVPPKKVRQAA